MDHFHESVRIQIGGIVSELGIFADIDHICTVMEQVGRNISSVIRDQDGAQTFMSLVSELSAFAEQFRYNMDRFAFVMFYIYPQIFFFAGLETLRISHLYPYLTS